MRGLAGDARGVRSFPCSCAMMLSHACGVSFLGQTRVSDLKGLTVVNQRKWPFLYERLVKEVRLRFPACCLILLFLRTVMSVVIACPSCP